MWFTRRARTAVGFVLMKILNPVLLKDGSRKPLSNRECDEIYEKQLIKFNKVISSIDEFKNEYLILMKLMKRACNEQKIARNNKMLRGVLERYYALASEKDKRLHKSLRNIEKEMAKI